MSTPVLVALAAVAFLALWWIAIYNALVRARNRVDESWSGVDVQLRRRYDLVPGLVACVRAYAEHERTVLREVTEARDRAMSALVPERREAAETDLGRALGDLRLVAEAYPELRAAEHFTRLMDELAHLEDEIQAARRIYNANVETHNTRIQIFPNSIVASGRFPAREFFRLERAEMREPRAVSFA